VLSGAVHARCGAPLAGAGLLLTDPAGHQVARTRTGPDGSYRVLGVPDGRYVLVASAEGHHPEAATVQVYASASIRQRFSLTPRQQVAGTVYGPGHRPLPEVSVTVLDPTGHVAAHTHTGPDGCYRLDGLSQGQYTLTATGYTYNRTTVHLPVRTVVRHDLILRHPDAPAPPTATVTEQVPAERSR
jgi:hypothetical protein